MKKGLKMNYRRTLFLSYLLLLALSVGVLLLETGSSLSRLEENTRQFSRMALSQVSSSMERAHGRILDQVNQVHSRDEYVSLVYADEDLNGYKLIKVGELEEEMIREASYNSYIQGMYIWFERPQIAATTQGFVRSRAQFDSSLRRNFGVDLDSVEAIARDTGLTLREVGNGRIIAVLASGRRSGDPDRSWETIEVMELDRSAFLSPLATQSTQGGLTEFWAVLPDGALLAPSQQVQLLAETVGLDIGEAEPEQGTIFRKNFEGRDYAVMTLRSSSGLWMCSAADYSAWSRTVSEHGATVLIFCVGYLLLGLVMAAGFTRANSQPVQRLSNLISEKLTGKEGEGDLAVLEAGVESLLRYWREYAGAQGREERQAREETLYSLLSGRLSQEDFLRTESGREMEFPSQRFAVVCISLRQLTGSFLEGRPTEDRESREIALFAVSSAAGEILAELGAAYTCRHDDRMWALVSPRGELPEEEAPRALNGALAQAQGFLREQMGILTGAYQSRFFTGWDNIPAAYREAAWAVEQIEGYAIPGDLYDLYAVEQYLAPEREQPGEDLTEKRRSFFSAVAAGDFDEAKRLYLELRRQELPLADESFGAIRVQSSILLGYLVSNLAPKDREANSKRLEEAARTIRLETRDEQLTEDMCAFMRDFHQMVLAAQAEGREERGDMAQLAVEYINDHFADRDISVAVVAENLGVSPSYLSRVFKKKYDLGVLDYIHRRRIDTAKVLLRESDLTVEAVAAQVGYGSGLALIRAFRKAEDCTPTEYRKSLSQGNP